MKNDAYDFPVTLVEIFTQSGEKQFNLIPKRQAVVRGDTGAVLGIVSDKYALLPHKEVVEGFRTALAGTDFQESIRLGNNGGRLYYSAVIPSVQVEVAPNDFVSLMVIAQNSYDATHTLTISFGAMRLVCTNGLIVGKRFINLSQKHSGKILKVNVEQIQAQIAQLTNQFKDTLPLMKLMTQTEAASQLGDLDQLFSAKDLGLPEYLVKIAENSFLDHKDLSVWGFYNSLTFAITHKMRRESPALAIEYGKVAWEAALKLTPRNA